MKFSLAAICLAVIVSAAHPLNAVPFRLRRLDHVVLKCRDIAAMTAFYTQVLGCTVDGPEDVGRFDGALTHLRAGEAYIDLLSLDPTLPAAGQAAALTMHQGGLGSGSAAQVEDVPCAAAQGTLDHPCLRVDPFDEAVVIAHLNQYGVAVLSRGQRKGADGVGPSVYLQDPEGNAIELKGPPGQASLA